jgi:hypothetical protein
MGEAGKPAAAQLTRLLAVAFPPDITLRPPASTN